MWPRRSRVRVPSITPNLFHPLQTGCTPHRLGDWKNGRRKMHRGGDSAPCTNYQTSGRSAAWLARLSGGQKVASSNLAVPTINFPQGTWVFARVPFFLPFSALICAEITACNSMENSHWRHYGKAGRNTRFIFSVLGSSTFLMGSNTITTATGRVCRSGTGLPF